jgi:hypothetical protein
MGEREKERWYVDLFLLFLFSFNFFTFYRPFLLLSEYIPGFHLANMPKEKSESILGSIGVLKEIGILFFHHLFLLFSFPYLFVSLH